MELIEGSETSAISTQDAGKTPKRKHITYKTQRKLKIKNLNPVTAKIFIQSIK
jgi:hypothetical protein